MLLVKSKKIRFLFGLLETFNFLYLKLWLKDRARARSFAGKVFRDYMSLVGREKWGCKSIDELFPENREARIILEHLPGGGISTPVDELAYLALVTKSVGPRFIFEIGTFRGRTALNFALNSPPDCVVYTLDLAPGDRKEMQSETNAADSAIIEECVPGIDYRGKEEAGKIRQLLGNSLDFDFSPYDGKMNIVFVDGAHHYEAALSDTRNALRLVAAGGVILWHDFANYGDYNDVTRAVLDLVPPDDVFQIDNTQLALYRKPAPKWVPSPILS